MNEPTQDTDNTSPDPYIAWEQAWIDWARNEATAFNGGWHSC